MAIDGIVPAAGRALNCLERLRDHPATPLVAALLTILGIKLLLIGVGGNPTPFWDQWDAEGRFLIAPWIDGTLCPADLVAPHNEHRILLSRLLSLALLEVAGNWNTLLEMAVNAAIHMAAVALLLAMLRRVDIGGRQAVVAVVAILLFGVPLDAENLLWGFQSQFYFLLLLSLAALGLMSGGRAFAPRWLVGAVIAAASFLALASGALTLLAAGALSLVQLATGTRRGVREWLGVALLVGGSMVLVALTPAVAGHQALRVHGIAAFVLALGRTAGWPLIVPLLAPVLLNLPVAVLLVRGFRESWPLRDPRWRIIGFALWAGLQAASIAYGRAADPVSSRYVDVYALLPMLNLFALLHLCAAGASRRNGMAAEAWIALLIGFTVVNGALLLPGQPGFNTSYTRAQVTNVSAYVRTRDLAALDRPRSLPSWRPVRPGDLDFSIPYPDPARLAAVLDRPAIRGALPDLFGAAPAARDLARRGLRLHGGLGIQPGLVATWCRAVGGLLLGAALALLLVSVSPPLRVAPRPRR